MTEVRCSVPGCWSVPFRRVPDLILVTILDRSRDLHRDVLGPRQECPAINVSDEITDDIRDEKLLWGVNVSELLPR